MDTIYIKKTRLYNETIYKDLDKSKSKTFTKYEENQKLNIISRTVKYLKTTKIIRTEKKQLFVSFKQPHKAVKSCTIANGLKNILAL